MREMKDSGISWVGEIPKEWSVWRNKYIFKITKDIVLPSENYQLLSLTTTGIKEKDENDNGGKVPENYDGYQIVKENDLVMCLFDLDCSAVFSGLSPYNGMISPAYKVLKVKKRIANEQYYRYWFNYVGSKRFYKQYSKSLRFTLNADEFNRLFSLLPPLAEQQRIAEFLDRACGKIDGLKADIQAQIDTLEQYKRSVITEAVTHGLNPSAPMKDSGIPWVGQFPTHWTKKMDGFAGAIGISDSRGKASPVLNVLNTKQNKKYIMYYLRSMAYGEVFTALSTGIRVRSCDLRWNKLAELLYPLPPIDEQNNIVNYIDEQIARTNEIIADKKTQIETLDDYKKSLIYEYVTGKKEVG